MVTVQTPSVHEVWSRMSAGHWSSSVQTEAGSASCRAVGIAETSHQTYGGFGGSHCFQVDGFVGSA
jgi:hypothetical protein